MRAELDVAGRLRVRHAVAPDRLARLLQLVSPEHVPDAVRHRSGTAFAVRGLLWKVSCLRDELETCGASTLARAVLGPSAFPVDATYFDKCSDANWIVPAHQDRTFPVGGDVERSHRVRDGIAYAEPDFETLAEMAALRIHFDSTDACTGALCVVPGSHLRILSDAEIRDVSVDAYEACPADPGDVLVMRPLLLHRSSPSRGAGHRRVLHVVYATRQPSPGLRWRGLD